MSAFSAPFGAIMSANAARHAANRNYDAQIRTNEMQIDFQKSLLGEGGKSVSLPWYTGDYEQKQLFGDAQNVYQQGRDALGSTSDQIKKYQAMIDGYNPTVEAGDKFVSSIYDDSLTKQRLQDLAPVQSARSSLASTQKQGVLAGLSERLNAINADNSRAGFVGNSTFNNNRLTQATIGARNQAAMGIGQANLENAQDQRGVMESANMAKLQSLDQPFSRAQKKLELSALPTWQAQQNFQQSLQPFNFFRRAGSQPLNIQAPHLDANIPPWAAAMAAGGSAASSAAKMYMDYKSGYGAAGRSPAGGMGGYTQYNNPALAGAAGNVAGGTATYGAPSVYGAEAGGYAGYGAGAEVAGGGAAAADTEMLAAAAL